MENKPVRSRALGAVYIANLLLAFHWYAILYINSSYLSTFVSEARVGLLYMIGSTFNLCLFLSAPRLLSWIGNYRFIVTALFLEAIAIVGLAFAQSTALVIPLFILHQGIVPMILFSLDIFLEGYAKDESSTGGSRGIFLTLSNLALVISPALVSLILTNGDFYKVYMFSSLFLIPLIGISFAWKGWEKNTLQNTKIWATFKELRAHKDVFTILKANFILQLFYAFMVIYLPIYLYQHIGFTWAEIGVILTVMFLPFLIFEFPIGRLADKKLGEKEILSLGFVVAGIATMLIALLDAPVFGIWALILFTTRIGASFIEITSESYFFKHVNSDNANIISFFRMTRPLSFIIAPPLAGLLLGSITYGALFGLVGFMMLFGLRYSLAIKDTR